MYYFIDVEEYRISWFLVLLYLRYNINTFGAAWPTGESCFFLGVFQKTFVKMIQVLFDFLTSEQLENFVLKKVLSQL